MMKFNEFMKIYLEGKGSDFIHKLSKLAIEDKEKYQKYRNRVVQVEDFHRQNQQRDNSGFAKPLTPDNFYTTEKRYNSMQKLMGKEGTDMTD